MSVEISPAELGFHRPFTQEVSQVLKIKNPNHAPVAFKVKTTAPKQYCVRPNSGRIEPGKEIEVSVLLQAMKQEPPLDAKCRDKFLVQSVAVTADKEFTNIAQIWQHVDEAGKSAIQEKKIRVVFLAAVNGAAPVSTPQRNGINGSYLSESTPDTAPPAYHSPATDGSSPQPKNAVGPVSTLDSEPANSKSLGDAKASAHNPATSSVLETASAAASAVTNAVPTSYEDLKAQLTEARAQLASLSQEGGLRMRKAVGANPDDSIATTANLAAKQATSEGVPVQIVAALCLLSFLLAYLFF